MRLKYELIPEYEVTITITVIKNSLELAQYKYLINEYIFYMPIQMVLQGHLHLINLESSFCRVIHLPLIRSH